MVSNYYINALCKKAKNDMYARWRLGEILHEATQKGYTVIMDAEREIIEIKKDVNK